MKSKKPFKIILIAIVLLLVLNMVSVTYGKIQCNRMIDAIKNNDIAKLESILRFANPNCVTDNIVKSVIYGEIRHTPLGEACDEGNFEMITLLVKDGADVNYVPIDTFTSPLGFAVQSDSSDNLKIVKYLIENGADVNYSKNNHVHPANIAVSGRRELRPNGMEILKVLMEAGADPEKNQVLRAACGSKNEEAIRYLVEEWGYDASDPACIGSYCYRFGEYSYETLEYFLERGANPYKKYRINKYIGEKSAIECLQEKSPEWAEKLIELAAKYGFEE